MSCCGSEQKEKKKRMWKFNPQYNFLIYLSQLKKVSNHHMYFILGRIMFITDCNLQSICRNLLSSFLCLNVLNNVHVVFTAARAHYAAKRCSRALQCCYAMDVTLQLGFVCIVQVPQHCFHNDLRQCCEDLMCNKDSPGYSNKCERVSRR